MYDHISELYNEYLEIYFDQCMTLPDAEKRKFDNKYNLKNLFLGEYHSSGHKIKKELTDMPPMPPLEGDEEEEVKEWKGLKALTRNKLSTRISILLAHK